MTTGFTVVHRESEWDDAARERATELSEWENGECPCGCGQRAEYTLVKDGPKVWDIRTLTCQAERAKQRVKRDWEQRNEGQPEGWADGVVHYAVPVDDPRTEEQKTKAKSRTRRKRGGETDD